MEFISTPLSAFDPGHWIPALRHVAFDVADKQRTPSPLSNAVADFSTESPSPLPKDGFPAPSVMDQRYAALPRTNCASATRRCFPPPPSPSSLPLSSSSPSLSKKCLYSSDRSFKVVSWNVNNLDLTVLSQESVCQCSSASYQAALAVSESLPSVQATGSFSSRKKRTPYQGTLSQQQDCCRKRLELLAEQLFALDADVIFLQELSNSCSLKMLVCFLNFLSHSRCFYPLDDTSSHPFYLCMSEYDTCEDPHSVFSPSGLLKTSVNSGFAQFKAVIYRPHSLLYHPLLIVPHSIRQSSLFSLASNKSAIARNFFPLGTCACSALLYPKPLGTPAKLSFESQLDSHFLALFRASFLPSASFPSFLDPLSLSSLFVTNLHLRSMRDPTNVYVRKAQVDQLKEWIQGCVFPTLSRRGFQFSYFMTLGDMNDYDNVVPDLVGNSNHILGYGKDEFLTVMTALKHLYVGSDLASDTVHSPLLNTAALRPALTRFSNSFVFNLRDFDMQTGAVCHILASSDLESFQTFGSLTSDFVHSLSSSSYLEGFYCSKLLGADLKMVRGLLSFDTFVERRGYSHLFSLRRASSSVEEQTNTAALIRKLSFLYYEHVSRSINNLPNPHGVHDLSHTDTVYPSDHVPVWYCFSRRAFSTRL